MSRQRVHSFNRDDALGELDAVGVAEQIRRKVVSPQDVLEASIARLKAVNPQLNALVVDDFDRARRTAAAPMDGLLAGVPGVIKDNTALAGLPTRHGSRATPDAPAKQDDAFASQFKSLGLTVLGKSRLPEFGFNASTEFADAEPTRNPWHLDHTPGGSSGGSAALVAAGVIPIGHANDGGGSIRIPAACCGLVGLKPTRGRLVDNAMSRALPIRIVCEGVVTRSVRDTATFFAGAEAHFRNRKLPPIGQVTGPNRARRRIGLVVDSITGMSTDAATRAVVMETAERLERLGHRVEAIPVPVSPRFLEDFSDYWGMLALLATTFGARTMGAGFDATQVDALTQGLAARYRRNLLRTPGMLMRLHRSQRDIQRQSLGFDAVLSPVLAHLPPTLGTLNAAQGYEVVFPRLVNWVAFTPLNNTNGTPAISLPVGLSAEGLPIGVQLAATHGAERLLLELALELEADQPFRRIQEATGF